MKTIEIKGFWGFVGFAVMSLLFFVAIMGIPVSVTWVIWNALVGEVFHGPMIAFWQAAILTTIFAVAFKIIFQPQISFQVKRVKNPEDLDKHLHRLKEQDSPKE